MELLGKIVMYAVSTFVIGVAMRAIIEVAQFIRMILRQ